MVYLSDEEVEIALVGLTDFSLRAHALAGLPGGYNDIAKKAGTARLCCEHVALKVAALIARLKQHQHDKAKVAVKPTKEKPNG